MNLSVNWLRRHVDLDGLSAAEILARTRGSLFWAAVYGLFVLAVALHAAIGLRNVLREWLPLRGRRLALIAWIVGFGLLGLGLRAIYFLVGTG